MRKKHLVLSQLKMVVLFNIFVETMIFFSGFIDKLKV